MSLISGLASTVGAVLVGALGASAGQPMHMSVQPSGSAGALASLGPAHAGMDEHVMIGPTGNKVEMVDPAQSTYVPEVAMASDRSRTKARRLLDGANTFCHTHGGRAQGSQLATRNEQSVEPDAPV